MGRDGLLSKHTIEENLLLLSYKIYFTCYIKHTSAGESKLKINTLQLLYM